MTRATLLLALLAVPCAAQHGASPSPFAGFEHHTLANGMRAWIRAQPGAADVSVGLVVPFGSDRDPVGKEETAHFLEHVLFSDHRGLSEEEIKDQVESRGGTRNGFTAADRTFYFVTTPAEHGLFGVGWLSRIVEPHDIEPDVVERNRQPVALEIGARPSQLPDRIAAWLDPAWLHRPGFWEREFGLDTRSARRYDRWAALHAIGPEDLHAFYETHYAPEAMTLVIVGDVEVDAALAAADSTFGRLARRPVPTGYGPLVDPGRADRTVVWTVRPNIRYQRLFKVYELDADRHVRLLFLSRLLDRRLTARLRFGETKAVYGVDVDLVQRGPAAYLALDAPVDPERFTFAREVVEEELAVLAEGRDPERFEEDRSALVERLIAENREPQDLVFHLYRSFYRPEVHGTFPDLAARFAAITPDALSPEVRALLDPDRQVVSIVRPHPMPQTALGAGAVLLALLALRLTRRALVTPARMRTIRYVARMRASPGLFPVLTGTWLAGGVALTLGLVAVGTRVAYALVVPVDAYPLHLAMWGVVVAASVVLAALWLSLPPRKLLVFDDHLRIKHLAYRSRTIPFEDIERVRILGPGGVLEDRPPWRTLVMTLGLTGRGVLVQPRRGLGYLVRVRDPWELADVLREAGVRVENPHGDAVPGAGWT